MGSDQAFTHIQKLCVDGKLDDVFHALSCTTEINFTHISNIFYSLLQGCIQTRNLSAGRRIYCQIVRHNLETVSYVGSHLIRMFAACRKLPDANCVFNRLPKPNLFAWNEIFLAHIALRCAEQALKLYSWMQSLGVRPDAHILVTIVRACASTEALNQGKLIHGNIIEFLPESGFFVWSALIDMYAKCSSMKDARSVFERLRRRNAVIWSGMIAGYVKHGNGEEAFYLYKKMQADGFDPDIVTIVSILKACAITGASKEGKLIHAQIVEYGFAMDATTGNSLLDMYARCGSHADACTVFNILRKRDVVTWSSMVESYVEHRDHHLALGFFELMLAEGLKPDEVAFLCLLSACSQLGLVQNGCCHFNALAEKFSIVPRLDHFNCMVDLLARAGCLIEAEDLLETMPFQRNMVGWRSLLCHCRSYSDVVLGNQCYGHVVQMDRKDVSCHVIMSNIHANASLRMDDSIAESTRRCIRASKMPGKATIMVQNDVHCFTVADDNRAQDMGLWDKLVRLSAQIKDWGYSPSLELELQPVFGEEKDDYLLHSLDRGCSSGLNLFQEGIPVIST